MASPMEELRQLKEQVRNLEARLGHSEEAEAAPRAAPRRSVTVTSTPRYEESRRQFEPTEALIDFYATVDDTPGSPIPARRNTTERRDGYTYYANKTSPNNPFIAPPDPMAKFTTSITSLLTRFTEVSRKPIPPSPTITATFSGSPEEDPEEFLTAVDEYIRYAGINDEPGRITALKGQLRGEAKAWIQSEGKEPVPYAALALKLYEEFDSLERRATAYDEFFCRPQAEKEKVEAFIAMKKALLRRIKDVVPLDIAIIIVRRLLLPAISSKLTGIRPRTLDELKKAAKEVEYGTSKEYRAPPRRDQGTYDRRLPLQCRWCRGDHLNKDCPDHPYRGQGNELRPTGDNDRRRPEPAPRSRGHNNATNTNNGNWRNHTS